MMSYQKNRLAVFLFSLLMKFSLRLQAMPGKITPPPFRLLQIGSAFWQSRALAVAVNLDLATILADETLNVDDIAKRASSHPDATYRLLRFLTTMGIFEESSSRTFRNNKLSTYLREDNQDNVRAMILMHNSKEMSAPWYDALEQGVRQGEIPFQMTHDSELFDYMAEHAEFNSLFSRAMDSVEALSGDSFVTDFDWQCFERIIDIGGSKGSKSLSILKRHPHLTAVVVDHEIVINEARHYWGDKIDRTILDRLSFQTGDVLDYVPAADSDRDVYLLSAVLHSFSDEMCVRALKNLATAIAEKQSRIILLEVVMDESTPDLPTTSFDMQMFMGTSGRERTLSEWEALFFHSGVTLEALVNLRTVGKMLVLRVS